jgi:phosphate transport system substrate-binding protein
VISPKRSVLVTAAMFTTLALFAVGCSSSKTTDTGSSTSKAGGSTFDYAGLSGTLNGSGSTFQKAFDEDAIAAFKDVAPGVTVNYAGGGSGKGKSDLASQVTQWAGSDSAVKDADLPTFKGGPILYFPTVAAPVTLSYNLSGVDKLRLSASTLAQIFTGKVTTWDAAPIAADNPGVTLPATKIVPTVRSDGSGTTSAFTNYLKAAGGSDWTIEAGDKPTWPTGFATGNGNSGMAQAIQQAPGSIGYVDYSDAVASKLTFASIKNKGGTYVVPSLSAASAAVNALDATGADSYPITAVTYVIIYQTQPDAGIGNALKGWVNYLLTDGQDLAEGANYAKLSSSLQEQALAQLAKLTIG